MFKRMLERFSGVFLFGHGFDISGNFDMEINFLMRFFGKKLLTIFLLMVLNGMIWKFIGNKESKVKWKNSTSHHLIEGHWEPSDLNTDKLRRSLYSETFEGEINGRRTFESPPKEEVFEDEQWLLKEVFETKSGLLEGRWIFQNKQSISQLSFISTNVIDGKVSVEFDN